MSLRRKLFVTACLLGLTTAAQAAPAMWEVRDDDSAIWLFGSVHVLPQDAAWRTPLFDSILSDADKVVFETDISPATMAELSGRAFVQGVYVDGTLLTDVIDDLTERQLRQYATSVAMQVGPLLAMRPWLATSTISSAAMATTGYTAEGVEFVLDRELPRERLRYLETGDEQLAVLSGGSDEEQVAMLQSTLNDIATLPKQMGKMLRSWMNGSLETLAELAAMETGSPDGAFMERLIYARNRNWVAPLAEMLARNEENLIVVGAAHLAGDGSVLDLLEQAGYEIERIQ